ncbi:fibronectin type III domain-containing protein [Vagococcus sp. WN89Y]|uniref:fibronectin type III domain-containing protein n=1 Tax=Vagococcus sp. WN89Y TaxID=3457258 RepID=UPI003FCD942B
MAAIYGYEVSSEYISFTRWSGELQITLTNISASDDIDGPVTFAFDMPYEVVPSTGSGFEVKNSGIATAHVEGTLPALPAQGSVTFVVNISSPNGTLSSIKLPTLFYINDRVVVTFRPNAPTGLRVTATTTSSISLVWNQAVATTFPIEEYIVYYDEALADTTEWKTITVQDTSATLTGLKPGTTYLFYVRAVDEQGGRSLSKDSALVNARTQSES